MASGCSVAYYPSGCARFCIQRSTPPKAALRVKAGIRMFHRMFHQVPSNAPSNVPSCSTRYQIDSPDRRHDILLRVTEAVQEAVVTLTQHPDYLVALDGMGLGRDAALFELSSLLSLPYACMHAVKDVCTPAHRGPVDACPDTYMDLDIDMCTDVCIDMFIGAGRNMYIDICTDMHIDMWIDK